MKLAMNQTLTSDHLQHDMHTIIIIVVIIVCEVFLLLYRDQRCHLRVTILLRLWRYISYVLTYLLAVLLTLNYYYYYYYYQRR